MGRHLRHTDCRTIGVNRVERSHRSDQSVLRSHYGTHDFPYAKDVSMTSSHGAANRRNTDANAPAKEVQLSAIGRPAVEALESSRGLLRVEEAAAWLSLGRTKTYELVARGELPSVCIGRSRRVPVSALASFVERLAIDGRV
jgi:excisionase family DNA binding protein